MDTDPEDLLPPDPLPKAPPAIEKVLDLNEAQTFKLSGTIAYIEDDTTNFPFSKSAEVSFTNPVPLLRENGTNIGYATVEFDGFESMGRRLEAKVFMLRETPERMDIELGKLYYPNPVFVFTEGVDSEPLEDGRTLIRRARLSCIFLSEKPPSDPAIAPLSPVAL